MKVNFSKWSLPLLWFFAFAVIIFMISITANAEENSYFPFNQNVNNKFDSVAINFINNSYNPESNYIFAKNIGVLTDGRQNYALLYWSKSSGNMFYGEVSNNGYQFSLYPNFGPVMKLFYSYNGVCYEYTDTSRNFSNTFTNMNSSIYSDRVSFVSNFVLYTNNNPVSQQVLLKYGSDPEPEPEVGQGHATPPDPFEDPTLATGSNHTLPREVPESPTINNYSWTVYNSPNIDTTNIESLLESLIYVINYLAGWLKDNLAGEFANLISNIQVLIQFIVNTIQYYGGLIISTIQNGIETFYNNMVSLFEPLVSTVSYITTPFDSDVINDSFENTNFYSIKTQFTSAFTTFDNAFDIAEPDSFTVVFNVQNITPLFDLGVRSPVTVDLGANFLPIRTALRTFLWILVTFGSVFVVEHGLSNWLRGARKE